MVVCALLIKSGAAIKYQNQRKTSKNRIPLKYISVLTRFCFNVQNYIEIYKNVKFLSNFWRLGLFYIYFRVNLICLYISTFHSTFLKISLIRIAMVNHSNNIHITIWPIKLHSKTHMQNNIAPNNKSNKRYFVVLSKTAQKHH